LEFCCESQLKTVGLVIIKPDAIDLGIEEYLIARLCQQLLDVAYLDHVQIVKIVDQIAVRKIYPAIEAEVYPILESNLVGREVVVLSFSSFANDQIDLWSRLKGVKGKSMWNWDEEMWRGKRGIETSVRGCLPVPGSDPSWRSIVPKVRNHQWMTTEEFTVYSQNLIHTPETLLEFAGVLDLFPSRVRNSILRSICRAL